MIRRSQWVTKPGAFCFPGGGIEPGETEEQALRRELQEELGVAACIGPRLWANDTAWSVSLCWLQMELPPDHELRLDPREVESFAWHTPEELEALPELLSSNRAFLQAWRQKEFHLDWRSNWE